MMEKHHVTRYISKVWTGPMDHWTFGILLDLLRTGFLAYQHLGRGVSSFFICREEETITLLLRPQETKIVLLLHLVHMIHIILLSWISYLILYLYWREMVPPTGCFLFSIRDIRDTSTNTKTVSHWSYLLVVHRQVTTTTMNPYSGPTPSLK